MNITLMTVNKQTHEAFPYRYPEFRLELIFVLVGEMQNSLLFSSGPADAGLNSPRGKQKKPHLKQHLGI